MKEAVFTSELMRSLRVQGFWAYKIPDSPITQGVLEVTRFTAAKPCDVVACYDGQTVLIECKQLKKWKAFGLKHIRDSQVKHLTDVIASGGKAYIFLNIRINASPRVDRLIILDWAKWGKRLQLETIKAKDLKALQSFGTLRHNGKKIYDLSFLKNKLGDRWLA